MKKKILNLSIWIELLGFILIFLSYGISSLFLWNIGIIIVLIGFILNAFTNKKEYDIKLVDDTYKTACFVEIGGGIGYLLMGIILYLSSIGCILYSDNFLCIFNSVFILMGVFVGIFCLVDGIRRFRWWKNNLDIIKPKNRKQTEVIWRKSE